MRTRKGGNHRSRRGGMLSTRSYSYSEKSPTQTRKVTPLLSNLKPRFKNTSRNKTLRNMISNVFGKNKVAPLNIPLDEDVDGPIDIEHISIRENPAYKTGSNSRGGRKRK
jgi:hypothetical protein